MDNIEKLRDICNLQSYDGNWNYSEYMRGLANGLILALAIIEDKEPKLFDQPKTYVSDKSTDESRLEKFKGWMRRAWR